MCFTKPPDPKPAPPPPDPNKATLAAASEQRMAGAGQGASKNIIARLKDEDVAASAQKKKLGQ